MNEMDRLNQLFQDYLKQSRARYGIQVQEAAPDLSSMKLRLTFLATNTYCWSEPNCHLGTDLSALRELAAKRGMQLPSDCVVHVHGVVEGGARFEHGGTPRAGEGYEYHVDLFDGCCGPDQEVNE